MAVSPDELAAKLAGRGKQKETLRPAPKPQPAAPAPRQRADKSESLPEAPEIEKAVLGAIFANPNTGFATFESLARKSFFASPVNREIYDRAKKFFQDNGRIDLIGFTAELGDAGRLPALGGPAYLTDIFVSEARGGDDWLRYYIEKLSEAYVRRQLIVRSFALAGKARTGDVTELLADLAGSVEDLKRAAGGANGAERMDLDELEKFDPAHDPNCLIGRRFLVRGGSWMIAGPTGCGKSSLLMQFAIYWALGQRIFGMKPPRPLKILVFQAEDDFGDVAEQDQGVIAGITAASDLDLDRELLRKNLLLYLARGISGGAFLAMLKQYVELHRPDIVAINPLFAFAGCDILDPSIGMFLRDDLFSLGVTYGYCTLVMHHVSKPPRDGTDAVSSVYLGFGSSEVQNSFRAVSTIVPLKESPGVWKLDFGKRTFRAGAKNPDGSVTDVLYMEHSKEGIYWLQVAEPESQKQGRPREYSIDDILILMSYNEPTSASSLLKKLHDEKDMSRRTFFRLWSELQDSLMIEKRGEKWVISANTAKSVKS